MAKGKHVSVSSENKLESSKEMEGEEKDLHESVSGESEEAPKEPTRDLVEEDFQGKPKYGEIESVTGFDPTRALGEGMPINILTDELQELHHTHLEDFPKPEDVCGTDDRVRISPATALPWRWICHLRITKADGGGSGCTGWFIGPRTVMTAGHCVYSHAAGGWARQIIVTPGMDWPNTPFGSQVGTSFRSVVGWTSNQDWNYDYGAIILPNNDLGNWVGYFGFASLTDASLNNLLVNNSGYPGDKPYGTQWFNAGRVTSLSARKFWYMLDTFGGQSGSPAWRYLNGQRHGVGVHAYGGCPNSATRITEPVFNNMLAWKNLGF